MIDAKTCDGKLVLIDPCSVSMVRDIGKGECEVVLDGSCKVCLAANAAAFAKLVADRKAGQ